MLTGIYQGEFLLYYCFSGEGEGEGEEEEEEAALISELLSIKCYLQLTEKGLFHEPLLIDLLEEYYPLFFCHSKNAHEVYERILMTIDTYKADLILFQKKKLDF